MLLSDLYNLDPVERVKVSRNTYSQPVGSEARLLAGYLGILARNANMLPINYESWHHMPDSNKNQALANIKERFALEVSDDYIKKTLGCESSRPRPRYSKVRMNPKLVHATNGKMRLDSGIQRKESKQKQKFTHTAGLRSFASVAEAEEVKSGQKVGRLQLFEITHRKKDGSPMTSEAGEIMEKLKEKKAEYEATTSTDSSVNLENIDNRIITKVWVLKGTVGFDFKDLVLPRPNILDPAPSNTCLLKVKLKLKFRVRLPPVTASADDADVSTVAKAAILDISFLVQPIKNIRTLLLQNCSPKCSEFWGK
ncbi:hypothetical protein GOBAR_AA02501 [Gossypium barbadense]|uniref:Uncharacterized protein n=1 Tax=Gossypium barbadense TaxID=3634 RepID=A0A2P5YRA2_GOSBA|nr:hypothetical protein GOBAR_AA02501 [Gossypium barbadense]